MERHPIPMIKRIQTYLVCRAVAGIILMGSLSGLQAFGAYPLDNGSVSDLYETGYNVPSSINVSSIKKFLDSYPVSGPEGLWGFEPDEVALLVLKDRIMPGEFAIYVVDAVDSRLVPGRRIGTLEETIETNTYRITLFSRWNKNRLHTPLKGRAVIDSKSSAMRIEGKSAKFSVTPNIILPNLLGLLRLRVRINVNDPESKIPSGLKKIYPSSGDLASPPVYL